MKTTLRLLFPLVCLLAFPVSESLRAQTFEHLWNTYTIAMNTDKPKDALAAAERVYARALQDHNGFQMIRAIPRIYASEIRINWQRRQELTARFSASDSLYARPIDKIFYQLTRLHFFDLSPEESLSTGKYVLSMIRAKASNLQNIPITPYSALEWIPKDPHYTPQDGYDLSLKLLLDIISPYEYREELAFPALEALLSYHSPGSSNWIHSRCMDIELRHGDDLSAQAEALCKISNAYPNKAAIQEAHYNLAHVLQNLFDPRNPAEEPKALEIQDLCNKSLLKFPKGKWAGNIRDIRAGLNRKFFFATHKGQVAPGQPASLSFSYTNLGRIEIKVYRLPASAAPVYNMTKEKATRLLASATLVYRKILTKLPHPLAIRQTYAFTLPSLPAGSYLVSCTGAKNFDSHTILYVSPLAVAYRPHETRQAVYAADLRTGKPYRQFVLDYYHLTGKSRHDKVYKKELSHKVALQNGFTPIDIPADNIYEWVLQARPATGSPTQTLPFNLQRIWYTNPNRAPQSKTVCALFTDRKLYQTTDVIFFKGICYQIDGQQARVTPGTTDTLYLEAPFSDKPAAQIAVTTNEFGSFSGEFRIPRGSMNGRWTLRWGHTDTAVGFQVEDYRRPTLEIEMQRVTASYIYGDTIEQRGVLKHTAGFGLAHAVVRYTLRQRPLWRWNSRYFKDRILDRGQVTADHKGSFVIPVTLTAPAVSDRNGYFSLYELCITATDAQGESRECILHYPASSVAYYIKNDLPADSILVKERQPALTLRAYNFDDALQEVEGTYKLYRNKLARQEGRFRSGQAMDWDWESLESGSYTLQAFIPSRDTMVTHTARFVYVSLHDVLSPTENLTFFKALSGEQPDFLLGTTADTLYTNMEIFGADSLLHQAALALPRGMRRYTLPYNEDWPSKVRVCLFGICGGQILEESFEIAKPRPSRNLKLTLHKWKNLVPTRSQTSFTIEVARQDSATAPIREAEVMLSLYDKTADRYGPLSLSFAPAFYDPSPYCPIISCPACTEGSYPTYTSPQSVRIRGTGRGTKAAYGGEKKIAYAEAAMEEDVMMSANDAGFDKEAGPGTDLGTSADSLRRETAQTLAFLPHLVTENGVARAHYESGETFGTFVLRVTAHTQDVRTGSLSDEVTVQDPLMVMPHYPAYLRVGDKLLLQAKVVNMGSDTLKGKVSLIIPEMGIAKEEAMVLEPGAQNTASWRITTPDNLSLLTLQTRFQSPTGSDGEQRRIPILSGRQAWTNSHTQVMNRTGTHRMATNKLMPSGKHRDGKLTVELSDPLGSAFAALPYMARPQNDGLCAQLEAYYTLLTGAGLLQRHAALQAAVVSQLEALESGQWQDPLSVNASLTEILLDETPWLARMRQYGENRRELHHWLDTAYVSENRAALWNKIKALQTRDGGFSWFPQMPSSIWMTFHFLYAMTRMRGQDLYPETVDEGRVTDAALNFADAWLAETYAEDRQSIKKDKRYTPSLYMPLLYLELRTALKAHPWSEVHKKQALWYLDMAEKQWNHLSILSKARVIFVMDALGRDTRDRMMSLSQYGVQNSTLGCYFPNAVPQRNLFGNELEAHALLLRLFHNHRHETAAYGNICIGLQQWLLLQKENQIWEDNAASCAAIHALLATGMEKANPMASLSGPANAIKQQFGFCTRYEIPLTATDGSRKLPELTVKLSRPGTVFVSAFYQFTQEVSQLEESAQGMRIRTEWVEKEDGPGSEKTLQIHIRSDENRNFAVLEVQRPTTLYPRNELSGYRTMGLAGGVYREVKASVIRYYFYNLPQGDCRVEESFLTARQGKPAPCTARIQSLYAPEYQARTRLP